MTNGTNLSSEKFSGSHLEVLRPYRLGRKRAFHFVRFVQGFTFNRAIERKLTSSTSCTIHGNLGLFPFVRKELVLASLDGHVQVVRVRFSRHNSPNSRALSNRSGRFILRPLQDGGLSRLIYYS